MAKPKVSIIIPTYNRAHYIYEAVESVFAQTYKNYEIIIIDDGSTDNTRETLKRYGDRIQYFYQKNMGPPAAMNAGVRRAKGEYYVILGDDDALMPDMLERQVGVLERDPDVAFVCGGVHFMDGNGQIYKTSRAGRDREKTFKSLLFDNFVWHLTAVVRRKVSEEMGHFDEKLATTHDYDLWIRIAIKYRFEYTDAPLARFRRHPGNYSKSLDLHLKDHLAILDKPVVREQLTPWEWARFRAVNYYRFGMFYARTGDYLKAGRNYWRAVFNYPTIGLYFWTHETQKIKFSMPYRFLKPYIAPIFYFVKFILQKSRLLKPVVQADNLV